MSIRSDQNNYVELVDPDGSPRLLWRRPCAWDTDHDAWQSGSKTTLPENTFTVLPNGATADDFKQLFALSGPHFNNVTVYLKSIEPVSNPAGGVPTRPPNLTMEMRIGIPCVVDHRLTALVQLTDYQQRGMLWSGCFPFSQALEIYGGVIPGDAQPANSVAPVRVKLRIVVAYSANDLGVATFETAPASITNGITVTLSP